MHGQAPDYICNLIHVKNFFTYGLLSNSELLLVPPSVKMKKTLGDRQGFHCHCIGEQGWHSGESTCLTPMWPGFDFLTCHHMWTEFVGSLLCS